MHLPQLKTEKRASQHIASGHLWEFACEDAMPFRSRPGKQNKTAASEVKINQQRKYCLISKRFITYLDVLYRPLGGCDFLA